jgi:cytochrome P450
MAAPPTSALPPGPRLPALVQTLLAVGFAERYTAYVRRRFGVMATLRIVGLGRFVSVMEPALIKAVFTGDPDVLRGGEANQRIGTLSRSSVVVLDGERHLRLRRLLLPPFHGEAVRRHLDLIEAIARAEVARWPLGRPFATLPRVQAITLEAILRAVIGVRDEQRAARLRAVLPGVLGTSVLVLLVEGAFPRLFQSRLAARLPWLRARREANRLLEEEIAAHRADPAGRDDTLALLLSARDEDGRGLTDEEIRDQLLTLLVAGHETTATTLAWAVERLVRHPDALARLEREVAGGDGDAYVNAVIDETLRVRPVVDQVGRKLARPFELGGFRLPAGTLVAPSILGVQLSDEFAEPERFRPERFLDAPAPAYTLIPFGGGTHRCIGASFAVMEMRAILRTVVERLALEPTTSRRERPSRGRRFTTVPSRGGRVVARPRQPARAT